MNVDLLPDQTGEELVGGGTAETGQYAMLTVPAHAGADASHVSYLCLGVAPGTTTSDWGKFKGATVGWRDHTDGNRCTTTRGEKVDVTGGCYRLHARARVDSATIPPTELPPTAPIESATTNESGFVDGDDAFLRLGRSKEIYLPPWITSRKPASGGDATGAGLADAGTPLSKTAVEDFYKFLGRIDSVAPDFTWEDHASGDRISTTGGNKVEVIRGDYQLYVLHDGTTDVQHTQSYTKDGLSEVTYATAIDDLTCAKNITTRTGTEQKKVDRIREVTFANNIESYTGKCGEAVTEMKTETWAHVMTEITYAAVSTTLTMCPLMTSFTFGAIADVTIAPASVNFLGALGALDVMVGISYRDVVWTAKEIVEYKNAPTQRDTRIGEYVERREKMKQITQAKEEVALRTTLTAIKAKVNAKEIEIGQTPTAVFDFDIPQVITFHRQI